MAFHGTFMNADFEHSLGYPVPFPIRPTAQNKQRRKLDWFRPADRDWLVCTNIKGLSVGTTIETAGFWYYMPALRSKN